MVVPLRLCLGLVSFSLVACSPGAPNHGRLNLLLITVDTLRADHLGTYGYERATSPAIDRLAQAGVVFEQAHATSS
ncbi:MAG: arylsulfatase A-like enzyme [Planctomycetota bacterium]|jgi:arylsulfatase A-like enzyme